MKAILSAIQGSLAEQSLPVWPEDFRAWNFRPPPQHSISPLTRPVAPGNGAAIAPLVTNRLMARDGRVGGIP